MSNQKWQMEQFNRLARNGMDPNGGYLTSGYDQARQGKTVVPYGTKPGWGQVGMGYRQASPLASAQAQAEAKARMDHMMRARWEQRQSQQALEAQVREHDAGYGNTGDARQFQGNEQWFGTPEITYGSMGSDGTITPEVQTTPTVVPDENPNWMMWPGVTY